ncbi:MAG: strawberry notch C-terminal domain-containing protein, partial [Verrucomicrobia bacterium]|nr:strawberry notch C-terminal domain-containing protein [Verrucomicrobiota bacterium]
LGLKVPAVVEEAAAAFKRGEKPIISLMNTMEGALGEFADDRKVVSGRPITLTMKDLIRRALDRTLRAHDKSAKGDTETIYFTAADVGLQAIYDSIVADIKAMPEMAVPVSPIDALLHGLRGAGMTVGEMTGRTSGIEYDDVTYRSGMYQRRPKADKNKLVNDFNSGRLDAIILNASGSTGLSLHASTKFKDQRTRAMIVAQAHLDITVVMQTFGRIKRTGMVPGSAKYIMLVLPLEAERRPGMMLERKMKSLNANTTAETTGSVSLDVVDFFNKYGDTIVGRYLIDAGPELQRFTRLSPDIDPDTGEVARQEDMALKFTGRMALRPNHEQGEAYVAIVNSYSELIEYLKSTDQYDLEATTYEDWGGELLKDEILTVGTDESSIFTASTRMQQWRVKDTRPVPTSKQMQREFRDNMVSTEKAVANAAKIDTEIERLFKETIAEREREMKTARDPGMKHALDHAIAFYKAARVTWQNKTAPALAKCTAMAGVPIYLTEKDASNNVVGRSLGVIVNISAPRQRPGSIKSAASGFTLQVLTNQPGGRLRIPLSQFLSKRFDIERAFGVSFDDIDADVPKDNRFERWVLAGNPIRAIDASGGRGRIVSFRANDKSLVNGLLMAPSWTPGQLAHDPRLQLNGGAAVARVLDVAHFPLASRDAQLVPNRSSGYYDLSVPAGKSVGGDVYLDSGVRGLTGDFFKVGNRMKTRPLGTQEIAEVADAVAKITGRVWRVNLKPTDDIAKEVREANTYAAKKGQAGGGTSRFSVGGQTRFSVAGGAEQARNNPEEQARIRRLVDHAPVPVHDAGRSGILTAASMFRDLEKDFPAGDDRVEWKNADSGMQINVTRTALRHSIRSKFNPVKGAAHRVLRRLIESAVHLETYAPRSADDLFTIRSMHVFYAAVRVDGRIYGVRLKAKDYVRPERGIGHYDLVAVEIEKAAGVTDAAVVSDSGQSSSPAASSVNVSDLLRGVKLEDGRIALPETAFSALRPQGSVQAADVRKRIEKLAGRLAFKVKVVQSISEMDPADREDAERSARAQGIVSTPRGVFSPSGTVYLVADGMADAREAAEALLHETVERGMDAIQTDDLMDLVHRALAGELAGSKIVADAWGRVEANYPGLDRKTDAGRRAFAREVIAHIAENRKRLPGMWTKLVRAVRAFLAKLAVGTRLQGRFGSGSQAERLIERLIDVAIEAGRMAGADRATADGRRKTEDGAGPDVGSRGKGSVQGLEGRDPMDSVTQGIARAMGAEPQGGAARFSVGWPSRENPYRTVIRTVRDDGQTRVLAVQTMSDEETFFETWVRDETIPGGWDLMGVATRESEAGDYSIEQTRAHRRALTQDHLDYIRTQPWYIRAWHRLGPEKATQSIIKGGGKMVAEQVSAGYDMSPRYEVENGRRGFYIPSRSKAGYGFTFVPADTLEGPGAEAVAGAQEGFSGPERPGAKVIELKQDYRSRAQEFMDDSGFRTVEEFYDYVTDDRSNGTEFAASAAFHTLSAHFGENIISATDPKIVLQFIAEVLEEADRLRAESERAPTATVEKPGFAAEGRTAFSAAGDTRFSATAPDGWSPHNQKIKELSDQVEALRQERDAVASRTREEERAVADAKIADIEAQLAAAKAQLKGAKANPRSAVRVAALEAELAEARRGTTQAVRQERAGLASRIAELEARIKQAKKDAVRMVSAERGRQMDAAAATEGRLRDTERQLRKSDRAAERQEAEIARKEALIQQLMAVRDKIPETQQLLMDYMAETLDDEGKQPRLPKEVSRRVVGAIVSTSRGKTEERIEERFRKAVEKIDAESVAYWKGQFRVRIEAMLDKPATFELNSKLAGKRGSQFYRDRVNEAKRLVNLSPRAAADEMGTIIEDSRNASSEAESSGGIIGITDEQRARIIMAEKFGALFQRRDVTLEEMRAAMAELESIIGRGMMEWEEREQEFRAETDRRVSDTVNAATGNKGLMTKPEEAARWNNRTAWRKLLDRAQGWDTMHQSLEHLLDKLDLRKDQPGMGGSLQQTFVRPAHDAQSERDRLVREHYEDMAKGKERVYGLKGRALARRLAKNQEVKKSGIFLSTPKGPQEMQMSRNQAIYWWTVFRHAETLAGVDVDRWATMSTEERKNLPGDGQLLERLDAIGWTQETKEQMERFLAPEDLAWGRWLMDRYESEYADFAPVYERLMYVKPPKLAGYVPLRTEFYGKFEDTGIPEGGGPIPSIFFAWSKLRKANLRAIRVADADAVTLLLACGTDFAGADPLAEADRILAVAEGTGHAALR